MKERTWAALVLAAVLLSGCGASEQTAASSAASGSGDELAVVVSAAPAGSAAGSTETMNAASTQGSDRDLTEEEVLAAYDRAVTAYEWFDLNALPCGGPVVLEDGIGYQRVEYAGFDTLDDLRTYLRSLFSEDVISRLLSQDTQTPRYRDIDGELYVHPGGREADPEKSSASAAVEQKEDGSYLINVTVDLLDNEQTTIAGVECYAFPYQEVNGRWVFTDFKLVY